MLKQAVVPACHQNTVKEGSPFPLQLRSINAMDVNTSILPWDRLNAGIACSALISLCLCPERARLGSSLLLTFQQVGFPFIPINAAMGLVAYKIPVSKLAAPQPEGVV